MAEFQWWLLLVGLVAGGGLAAAVLLDGARREADLEIEEIPAEAAWIADRLRAGAVAVAPEVAEAVLHEHRAYRQLPPPDRLEPPSPASTPPSERQPSGGPPASGPAVGGSRTEA